MSFVNRDLLANKQLIEKVCKQYGVDPASVDWTHDTLEFTRNTALRAHQVNAVIREGATVLENDITGRTTIRYKRIHTAHMAGYMFNASIYILLSCILYELLQYAYIFIMV